MEVLDINTELCTIKESVLQIIERMNNDDTKLLDVGEAAKILNVSRPTLWRMMKYDGLPYISVGTTRKFTKPLLREYINKKSKL